MALDLPQKECAMAQQLAVVTGGAGDIGRAIAARLKRDHDLVLIVDLDLAAAERAVGHLGAGFAALKADVTNAESCAILADEIAEKGQLVTLVNNAGAARGASLQATTPADWAADRALNLDAAFLVFNALADQLKASQGSVTNIVSVNGLSQFGHPAYSAAKAGMIHLTRSIAVEYGKYGIRANSVAPGTVRTQAWEARAVANPDVFKEAASHYALGRIVKPEDVAEAVGFLASPLAAAITGICLPVDCGLTAGIPALARTFSQSDDY
jgi:NAD(P)-dependent dehydrogenase (short-subunit alcohol dehydrogenase family)